jgi:hypothetical protein
MRYVAVDWSGRVARAEDHIVAAEVAGRELVRVVGHRTRPEVVADLIERAERNPTVVVGFDFAFSLPAWFVSHLGCADAPSFWDVVRAEGEGWLRECPAPFWGRKGRSKPTDLVLLRDTDCRIAPVSGITPKSPFQIGGAGAVGSGSLRGMPYLISLRDAGFSIWPFDPPRRPLVVEIYPRVLTGVVRKSSPQARSVYLAERHSEIDSHLAALASASEDAFDATVSALAMASAGPSFASLPEPQENSCLEGQIWYPAA